MTRNVTTLYRPAAPARDVTRYDLPNEMFRITLANLPRTVRPPSVSVYDPLRNTTARARIVALMGGRETIELAVTDYPRLLTLTFAGA
jgi:hypothetical protein